MAQTLSEADLDLLAYDLADMLDRNQYATDVAESDLRPYLAELIAKAEAHAVLTSDETSPDASSAVVQDDEPERPHGTGKRTAPKLEWMGWFLSQGVQVGGRTLEDWYWFCPVTGCKHWTGGYDNAMTAKSAGMDHRYHEHAR